MHGDRFSTYLAEQNRDQSTDDVLAIRGDGALQQNEQIVGEIDRAATDCKTLHTKLE